jgi:hypothetical protein
MIMDSQGLDRRDFLRTAALAGGAFALGPSATAQAPNTQGLSDRALFDRPMRWAQLTLVEDDPGKYDLAFWLDYFKRTHSDAACLSAGGCVAFYPTKIPLHYRSKWLGDRDPFGDLVSGCRKLGMTVVARTDPHAAHQDVFDAHPDWIAVDAEGHKRRHWVMPELWVTCALGPYNFEFMTAVTKEIVALYKVDGVFSNRWAGSGMCYCEHCQANFKAASGLELPRTNNPQDPRRRAHNDWRQQRLFELAQLWDSEIRRINPAACFIPNSGGGALSNLDMKTLGARTPILVADRQARSGVTPPWAAGKNGKEFRATAGRAPVAGLFSVGVEEQYRWKDSVQSAPEIRLWVLEGIANGMRPWFTKFGGVLYDRRWLKPVEDIYIWHHRNERYLRNEESLARVGLVYSQQTAAYYGAERAQAKVEDHILGWYQALIEARIPFEMVHDHMLDPEQINRFRVLILPNIAALSDRQCQQLRDFEGSIVATHETSLYDEWGVRRKNFGLTDLFRTSFAGQVEARMQNSYLRLERGRQANGLLAGLEDTDRIINGVSRVHTQGVEPMFEPIDPPLTLIPSYPDLPMEEVFPRQPETNTPGVYMNELTGRRIVYFPWDIDRTFWEVLSPDHGRLMRNAVTWAASEQLPVMVKGEGMLDVTIWRQKDSLTVHLVNLNNPMTMKGPLREFIPSPPQTVFLELPDGRKAKKVQLLVGGQTPHVLDTKGVLSISIESIVDHEVVAIDL